MKTLPPCDHDECPPTRCTRTSSDEAVVCKELLGRRVDGDLSALKACIRGLNKSTSRRMLTANLEFLLDRYLWHPSSELPEHLRPNAGTQRPGSPDGSLATETRKPGSLK